MDAFYASVEQRDRPELRGRPVIVGADPRGRGVVSAASYEARRFGVHSAMPIGRAARLCPDGRLPAGRHGQVRARLAPDHGRPRRVHAVAGAAVHRRGVSRRDRERARCSATVSSRLVASSRASGTSVDLTASVGVASNKFIAKVASDLREARRPRRRGGGRRGRSSSRPCRSSACGASGASRASDLESMGIRTIGQLAAMPLDHLDARFGRSAIALSELAHGQDERPVEPFAPPKSMGAEETFERDHRDVERLRQTLRGQAERVARELRAEGFAGRTVTLKLRFADFRTITRSHTDDPTQDGLAIYRDGERAPRPRGAPPAGQAHRTLRLGAQPGRRRAAAAPRPRHHSPRTARPRARPSGRAVRGRIDRAREHDGAAGDAGNHGRRDVGAPEGWRRPLIAPR